MTIDEVYLGPNVDASIDRVYKDCAVVFERGGSTSYGTNAFNWWEMETTADYTTRSGFPTEIETIIDKKGNLNLQSPSAGLGPTLDTLIVPTKTIARGYTTTPGQNADELIQENFIAGLNNDQFKFMYDGSAYSCFFLIHLPDISASSGLRVFAHTATGGTNPGFFFWINNNNQIFFRTSNVGTRVLDATNTVPTLSPGLHLMYIVFDPTFDNSPNDPGQFRYGLHSSVGDNDFTLARGNGSVYQTGNHLPLYTIRASASFRSSSFALGLTYKDTLTSTEQSDFLTEIKTKWGI